MSTSPGFKYLALLVVVAVAGGMWLQARRADEAAAAQVVSRSDGLWLEGRWKDGADLVQSALQESRFRRSRALHVQSARFKMAAGNYRGAADEFREWAPPPADDPLTAIRFARCLLIAGRAEDAQKVLQTLMSVRPDTEGLALAMAEVEIRLAAGSADPSARRSLMDQALSRIRGTNVSYARSVCGAVLLDRGDAAGALRELDLGHPPDFGTVAAGTLLHPEHVAQYESVAAAAFLQLGRLDEARAHAARAGDAVRQGLVSLDRNDNLLDRLSPFLLVTPTNAQPVLYTFPDLAAALVQGAVWSGNPIDTKLLRRIPQRALALERDGFTLPVTERVVCESLVKVAGDLEGQDFEANAAEVDRLSAAISHVEALCAPWDLVQKRTLLATLQLLTGDVARQAHRADEARARYQRAAQEPMLAPLVSARTR